jgi:hypothetical protein
LKVVTMPVWIRSPSARGFGANPSSGITNSIAMPKSTSASPAATIGTR